MTRLDDHLVGRALPFVNHASVGDWPVIGTAAANPRVAAIFTDNRPWAVPAYLPSNGSSAVTAADVDLTAAANADKARCSYLTTTGALTANRNVIVPNSWRAIVFCNNSGAFTTTLKTAAGSGVLVAQGGHPARRRHQRREGDAPDT